MSTARQHHIRPPLEQWERTLRWWERCRSLAEKGGDEEADYALVVVQNVFAMRDWLLQWLDSSRWEAGRPATPTPTQVREFFRSTDELKLCRDIANGSKHLVLNSASLSPDHRLVRAGDPWGGPYQLYFLSESGFDDQVGQPGMLRVGDFAESASSRCKPFSTNTAC